MSDDEDFLRISQQELADMEQIDEDILNGTEEEEEAGSKKKGKLSVIGMLKSQMEVNRHVLMELKALKKKGEEKMPVSDVDVATKIAAAEFRTRGLGIQFTFNANMLAKLKQSKDPDCYVREVMEELEKRNNILQLGDKNPRVFQLVDAEEASKVLGKHSEKLSKDVRDLFSTESIAPKRKRFLGASSFNAHGGTGSYSGNFQRTGVIPSLLDINVPWRKANYGSSTSYSSSLNPIGSRRIQCYSCQGYDHISKDCPVRKANGRRSQYCYIGAPSHILDVIRDGYRLPFKPDVAEPRFSLPNVAMNAEDMQFTGAEIAKLLESQAVSPVVDPPQVISSLFVVRNTGKPRLIINLSKLNKFLDCPKFRYEDLSLVSRIITPVGWLAKYDMKSGYHHIGIFPDHRKFLGFSWITPGGKVRYFVFNVLPFGLSPAPFIFTKVFRCLVAFWRRNGISNALYIDDGLTKNIYHTICAFSLLDKGIPLMPKEEEELFILEDILSRPLSRSLLPPSKVFSFSSDASAFALGVVAENGETFSRPLNASEMKESSTFRELLAVQFGILCFEKYIEGAEVHVFTDNQNLVPILRKGSMVLKLNLLAVEVHEKLSKLSASVFPHWIPREENKDADLASRIPDCDDWAIMPHVFDEVNKKLGPADVDRFANCLNKKLSRFNSTVPSPGTEAVDAFTQDWSHCVNYCVPPVNLLFSTVTFVLKHKYPAIIGFPFWPALPIMPLLLNRDGDWKREIIKDIFRIPKGECFLVPGSNHGAFFSQPFLKSDFVFVRLF